MIYNPESFPKSFPIDGTNRLFYNAKHIHDFDKELFKGYKDNKYRQIIERRNIPSNHYKFAYIKNDKWVESSIIYKPAKCLLSKEWVELNLLKNYIASVVAPVPIVNEIVPPIVLTVADSSLNPKEEAKEERKNDENAPPILELEDEEKFQDTDGNIIEIETRGERHVDKIFFRAKCVSIAFDMPNIKDVLLKKDAGYERGVHFKTFNSVSTAANCCHKNPNRNEDTNRRKIIYLTYSGLVRVLFVSRNKNAENFTRWAVTNIFTIQMGTKEDKEVLGAKIFGVDIDNARAVFKKHSDQLPVIYLLKLGRVEDLRETFEISETIDKDSFVYKFGFSDDIDNRLLKHKNDYNKLKNVNASIELYRYVDPKYTTDAEGEMRNIFDAYNMRLNVPSRNDSPGRNELVVLNKKQLERVRKDYTRTGQMYAGATKALQEEIVNLKHQIQNMESEMEKKELQHTIALRDEQMRTMEERKAKETLQRELETQNKCHALEIKNLQSQAEIHALNLKLLQNKN